MAKAFWHPEARQELEKLDETRKEFVLDAVTEFEKQGLEHEEFDIIEQNLTDSDFYRLKVEEKEEIEISRRLIISDYFNKWIIYGLKHREEAYEEETIIEMEERQY